MEIKKELQEKIQELQFLEQNLNGILMQKQAFQLELTETENALLEISKTSGEVYKIVGSIMVKSDKTIIEKDLKKRQELFSLRMKSIEKQEEELTKQSEELRAKVMKSMN
jgi:prefoldin beta subunit